MIRTDKISISLGDFNLNRITLHIEPDSYFVLLGPPGSGKSVFLQCLCGLQSVDSGSIHIAGRDVTHLEPRQRSIGYVPQDYDLFPHLSVWRNIAFGLQEQAKHLAKVDINRQVTEMADMLGIGHLLKRSNILGLSGGERQRVALARALVLRPRVLVLDEPVSALDEATRQTICHQLLAIQRQLHLTTIHVSHVLEEAFTVADKAAVMYNGTLKQVGPIGELLRKPANEFVARFMRCENIFPAKVISQNKQQNTTTLQCNSTRLIVAGLHTTADNLKIAIRPESIIVSNINSKGNSPYNNASAATTANDTTTTTVANYNINNPNTFPVTLKHWRDCGIHVRLQLQGNLDLIAYMPHTAFTVLHNSSNDNNDQLMAYLPPKNIYVLQ